MGAITGPVLGNNESSVDSFGDPLDELELIGLKGLDVSEAHDVLMLRDLTPVIKSIITGLNTLALGNTTVISPIDARYKLIKKYYKFLKRQLSENPESLYRSEGNGFLLKCGLRIYKEDGLWFRFSKFRES